MKEDLVSIIMPPYKCWQYISDSIKSVQAQTYRSWELIIVDDCSGDETIEIAADFKQRDERIIILQNSRNSGAAVSRNTAFPANVNFRITA